MFKIPKRLKGNTILNATILIFFLSAIFMVVFKIGYEQIKIWDESSAAKGALEMLTNKNYLIAYSDGQPDHYDVKPPLQLWLKVVSYKIFGINEFAVRFPTIISAIGIMLLLGLLLKQNKQKWAIIPLYFLIAITPGFMGYHVARHGDTDTLLLFFVSGYFVSFYCLLQERDKRQNLWLFLFSTFVALATYTKSIAGLAPLIGFPLYFFLYKEHWNLLHKKELYISILGSIVAISFYYVLREIKDPGFLNAVYKYHFLVIKDYPGKVKHPEFSFYFTYLRTSGFKPLLNWLPLAIIPLIWSKNKALKKLLTFSIISVITFLLGQSALVMKNEWYIAPIYLFLWVWLALSIYETFNLFLSSSILKKAQPIIVSVAIIGLVYFYVNRYRQILNHNLSIISGPIYHPERSGHYLRDIGEEFPEINKITIAHSHNQRQVKFYTIKYAHLNGTQFDIVRKIDANDTDKYILTTEKKFKDIIEQNFNYQLIDSARYGKLYYIETAK